MTRDSILWTLTLIASFFVFLGTQFDLLSEAFPSITPMWEARISLVAALSGMLAGYLKMSPLPLAPNHTLAGTSDPDKSLNPMLPGGGEGKK